MGDATGTKRWQPRGSGFKSDQQDLVNTFQSRVQGDRPSVAEEQLAQGLDQTLSDQVSAVRSAPGVSPGLKARMIQKAGQKQASDLARAKAVLRAGEQSQAEQNLASTLQGARAQDQAYESLYGKGFESAQKRRGGFFDKVVEGAGSAATMFGGGM